MSWEHSFVNGDATTPPNVLSVRVAPIDEPVCRLAKNERVTLLPTRDLEREVDALSGTQFLKRIAELLDEVFSFGKNRSTTSALSAGDDEVTVITAAASCAAPVSLPMYSLRYPRTRYFGFGTGSNAYGFSITLISSGSSAIRPA